MNETMQRLLRLCVVFTVIVAAGLVGVMAVPASGPKLTFSVFARPAPKMDSIVWTGSRFLYVENTANTVWAAPLGGLGLPIQPFASMPMLVEETRCVLSPGAHGFMPGALFCHSPDSKIYEISGDGTSVSVFATLPVPNPSASDGALAFDDVGSFGYRLIAATGRSGALQPSGGVVYTIDASGRVDKVGKYPGPGGADEVAVAPAGFGSVAGQALLTVDPGAGAGTLVAIDPDGRTRTIAKFSDGPNPIAPIPRMTRTTGAPPAGLYVTDDSTGNIYFAPAAELARFAGDVIVGTELGAHFFIVTPHGRGFIELPVRHNLRGGHYSLEGAIIVG